MRERFNTLSFPLAIGEWPQSSMHSLTRVELEEQVDYSEASRSVGGLGILRMNMMPTVSCPNLI